MTEQYTPTTEEVRELIAEARSRGWQNKLGGYQYVLKIRLTDALESVVAERDAALACIAEVSAKAWSEGWSARASRGYAHLKAGECVPPPDHINPYRKAANYPSSGSYGSVLNNREELHD